MTSTAARRPDLRWLAILGVAFAVAAIVGAYVDWLWWPVYSGLMLTIAAGPVVLIGLLVTLVGHGPWHRIGSAAISRS